MGAPYLLALDQGTTSSRAIVFTLDGVPVAQDNHAFSQIYPHPGWVEHDPMDLLRTQTRSLVDAVKKSGVNPSEIAAIGITNQRETTLLWDRATGEPVYNAIVWQCRRTADAVERIATGATGAMIRAKTGLVPDAYFSASKLQWLLELPGVRERAEKGTLCFGTVDTWLAFNLCKEKPHVTDATNACRTMLFNLYTQTWDEDLLNLFQIPAAVLPRIVDTAEVVGTLREDILGVPIPIAAMVGDQHAALFGQRCIHPGEGKNTYGTGCFLLMNTGDTPQTSWQGLLTTMAWRIHGRSTFALEGSVFIGGAVVQWLRDEMGLIQTAAESETVARSVEDSGGVVVVPAFVGLGAPYWDAHARGAITGLTRGSNRAHIVHAALSSIAQQSADLVEAMEADMGSQSACLRVDGGASANRFLMQMQADLLGFPVERPAVLETTARGAALFAALGVGLFASPDDIPIAEGTIERFSPQWDLNKRAKMREQWKKAIALSTNSDHK